MVKIPHEKEREDPLLSLPKSLKIFLGSPHNTDGEIKWCMMVSSVRVLYLVLLILERKVVSGSIINPLISDFGL